MDNLIQLVEEYSQFAESTDTGSPDSVRSQDYPLYLCTALAGEVGETANQIKKVYRDDNGKMLHDRREEILFELGDIAWYLTRLAANCGYTLSEVLTANRDKLTKRVQTGTLTGKR